jgi:uncharacterized protein YndB with AHSA1/START domain
MLTRKQEHSIELAATPERVFAILHTPRAIRRWWFAANAIVLPQPNGFWSAVWGDEDAPDYISAATIAVFDPPRRLLLTDFKYYAKSGPLPFHADLSTEFTVLPAEGGAVLRVVQDGFPLAPAADEFYVACEKGWRDTLASVESYLNDN